MKIKLTILSAIISLMIFYAIGCDNSAESQNQKMRETAKIDVKNENLPAIDYLEEGKKIAVETQGVLGKNLVNAMNTGGSKHAVEFCNIEAMQITDSMANVLHTRLKRVSDKPRNPGNQANEAELKHLKYLKKEMENGRSPQAKVVEINGQKVGYYAIVTNEMCLKCHGDKDKTIETETFEKIQKLYPSDKALGYETNELRGMWVVEMLKR